VRDRFESASVARLATVDVAGQPHLVPVTFAMVGESVVIAIDHKPKTTTNLKRLRNIEANPRVSLLVDHYDEDWTQLWWVRADGLAHVLATDPVAVAALQAKYPQYRQIPPTGPVIRVEVHTWRHWSYE
jgi:PPOX class probable F420-dependent enzyme